MSHLYLFSQLPIGTRFRFENPNTGDVLVKTSEAGANHDGAFQRVSPSILVFPIKSKIVSVTFVLSDFTIHVADPVDGRWSLDADYDKPGTPFNTLDDVIDHLEG